MRCNVPDWLYASFLDRIVSWQELGSRNCEEQFLTTDEKAWTSKIEPVNLLLTGAIDMVPYLDSVTFSMIDIAQVVERPPLSYSIFVLPAKDVS